jgi:hypothetical protein
MPKNKQVLKYLIVGFITAAIFFPLFASADEPGNINLDVNRLVNIMNNIKVWFAEAIFILGIITILYAAFLYMTAGGDDTRIDKAKKAFVWGIVGIIIAMLAYGIWDAVYSFLAS